MPFDPAAPPGAPVLSDADAFTAPVRRPKLSRRAIERRARAVALTKRLLPAAALLLLSLIVLWPEFSRLTSAGRDAVRRLSAGVTLNGELLDPHYRGVDTHGHAYTLTAANGFQESPGVVRLLRPKADTTLEGGAWVMVWADHGTFEQHRSVLDLWGHVVLYRDDGLMVRTETATLDLKAGFAAGTSVISAEGPFGTLDAYGFAIGDKGAMAQFAGPARLVLNMRR